MAVELTFEKFWPGGGWLALCRLVEGEMCVCLDCSVLQCVAVCCSVLQCVAVYCSVCNVLMDGMRERRSGSRCISMYCSVLHHVAVCRSVLTNGERGRGSGSEG